MLSGSLNVELDVGQLGADLDVPYTEYDPANYHGLYVRLEEDGPLITYLSQWEIHHQRVLDLRRTGRDERKVPRALD